MTSMATLRPKVHLVSDDDRLVGRLKQFPEVCRAQPAAALKSVALQPLRSQGRRGTVPGLVQQV